MEHESHDQEQSYLTQITNIVSKNSFFTKAKQILQDPQLPPLFIASFMRFLTITIKVDFKKSIPVINQLDIWTVILQLLNQDTVFANYNNDS